MKQKINLCENYLRARIEILKEKRKENNPAFVHGFDYYQLQPIEHYLKCRILTEMIIDFSVLEDAFYDLDFPDDYNDIDYEKKAKIFYLKMINLRKKVENDK